MQNKYIVNPDLYLNHVENSQYIYVLNNNIILMNENGHFILNNISSNSVEEIINKIIRDIDSSVSKSSIEFEIKGFIEQLKECELILEWEEFSCVD